MKKCKKNAIKQMLAEFQEINELNVFLDEGFRNCWRLASDDEFSELSFLMGD